jgi:hypothetical protein
MGRFLIELKTPYRDDTIHVIFETVDFIAKLAALLPGVNLTYHHNLASGKSDFPKLSHRTD